MSFEYSLDGEINRAIFHRQFNDVNFFVEDKDKEYEYEVILKRLFSGNIGINTIFGVGGKESLIEAYRKLTQKPLEGNVINIFLADLDFDKLLNKQMIEDERFIYLDRYCIENYLIDETAVTCFMQGRICKLEDEVCRIIKFDYWFRTMTEQFYELFVLFTIVQKNGLPIQNCGSSTFEFLEGHSWCVDTNKIRTYYSLVENFQPDLDMQIKEMEDAINRLYQKDITRLISGKFYYDSLKFYLRKFTTSIFDKDFRMTLIRHFDINKLNFIKNRVIGITETQSSTAV